MKRPLFYVVYLCAFLGLCGLTPRPVHADGMIIEPGSDTNHFDYSNERDQQVFIDYTEGREKMLVSIGIDTQKSSGMVWLFPLPASPEKITADIKTELPYMFGNEITATATANLKDARDNLWATQLYPSIISSLGLHTASTSISDGKNLGAVTDDWQSYTADDVQVYDQVVKEGMTTEIVSAKTAAGLITYLQAKGLQITNDSIPVLTTYLGQNYSFVVSWITGQTQTADAAPTSRGVYVTFPTDRIFFPLLPTSVYGSRTVPATIRITGHVTPQIFSDIKPFTTTEYFLDRQSGDTPTAYTKITIAAPSKLLTDDLWVDTITPPAVSRTVRLITHEVLIFVILFLVSSALTGIIAGLICFPQLRRRPLKLAWIGLGNCATLYGLILATNLARTKAPDENFVPVFAALQQQGYPRRRRFAATMFMIALPILALGLLALPSMLTELRYASTTTLVESFLSGILILYVLPVALIGIGWFAKRIRNEDARLFEQLRWGGYSTWTMNLKDPAKLLFVPVYSLLFLLISWSLVGLLRLWV